MRASNVTAIFSAVALVASVFALPAFAATADSVSATELRAQIDELNQEIGAYKEASEAFDDGVVAEVAAAQTTIAYPPDEYLRGTVVGIESEETRDIGGTAVHFRTLSVRLQDATEGAEKGSVVQLEDNDLSTPGVDPVGIGDRVALVKVQELDGTVTYHVADRYRVPALLAFAALFAFAAIVFGGKRGFTALIGLTITVLVLVRWAVPTIMSGAPVYPTILAAAVVTATVSLYVAHGFRARTTLALVCTLLTLGIGVALEFAFVHAAALFGNGSEEAFFLQGSSAMVIDLRGLLLGGILLGVLGILDDVTTAQVAVVEELKDANPSLRFNELYRRGLSVGREHIASLTNTLFLAYAGASLPLFLLFAQDRGQPLWFVVNSALIAEEIVRTLTGSIALILAVPITTALAAKWFDTRLAGADAPHGHAH